MEIDVCALRLPGRESRIDEPPIDRMVELVAAVADALEDELTLPFALFGECSGALVAFELAHELRRRGWAEPAHLFVAGQTAPGHPSHGPPPDDVWERVELLGGIHPLVHSNAGLRALLEPALRADFRIVDTYARRDEPSLAVPITVYAPAGAIRGYDAWRRETEGAFELIPVDSARRVDGEAWRTTAEATLRKLVRLLEPGRG